MSPTLHPSMLDAKVTAVNDAHREANRLFLALRAALAPLVGCKVIKVDGYPLKSVQATLAPVLKTVPDRITVYMNHSPYSLSWTVKTCENTARGCTYHEAACYVANLRDGVLESLYPLDGPGLRCDYTPAEVARMRETVAKHKAALNTANSALAPFGEYDR